MPPGGLLDDMVFEKYGGKGGLLLPLSGKEAKKSTSMLIF
jgi:hypothetical protein